MISFLFGALVGALAGFGAYRLTSSKLAAAGTGVAGLLVGWLLAFFAELFGFPLLSTLVTTSVIAGAAAGALSFAGGSSLKRSAICAASATLAVFVFNWWLVALEMPTFTGIMGGYGWLVFWNAVIVAAVGAVSLFTTPDQYERASRFRESENPRGNKNRRDYGGAITLAGGCATVLAVIAWSGYVYVDVNVGAGNKEYYTHFIKVRESGPDERLPSTDAANMIQVPLDVACSRAQNTLNQNAGLATLYKVVCSEITVQEVDGHLWGVAPLEYQNDWSQRGWPGATFAPNSPGYVMVDMQAANGTGRLMVGPEHELNYFPSAMLERNLERHIYTHGYNAGIVDEITLEIEDTSGHHKPWFTATYNTYERTNNGERIRKVLLIDPRSGEIREYDLGKTPEWVDRVMSRRLRLQYANDYLQYGWDRRALDAYTWYAGAHGYQFKVQDERLVVDASRRHPLSLMTITSNDGTNDAVVAVMACATHDNDCVIYRNVKMQSARHAEDACNTLMSRPGSIAGRLDGMQPYVVLDRLTWVSPIAQRGGTGIAGFCLADATVGNTSASNAAIALDLRSAVYQYGLRLDAESNGNNAGQAGGPRSDVQTLTGKILWIGPLTFNGEILYQFTVEKDGQPVHTVFLANPQHTPVAMLQRGDEVTITYRMMEHTAQRNIDGITSPKFAGFPEEMLRLGVAPASADGAQAPNR